VEVLTAVFVNTRVFRRRVDWLVVREVSEELSAINRQGLRTLVLRR